LISSGIEKVIKVIIEGHEGHMMIRQKCSDFRTVNDARF